MVKSVEHCDNIVGSMSPGRWLMTPSEAPYLRPSLAIRDSARFVGYKPALVSRGT
jgi:hypothetical protein